MSEIKASNTLLLRILAPVLKVIFWPAMDLRTIGIPPKELTGKAIYVCNHRSFLDFVAGLLTAIKFNFPVRFLIAAEYCEIPVLGWIIRNMGAIPVYRNSEKKADSLEKAKEAIAKGAGIIILPEGTRKGYDENDPTIMGKLHTGAVRLALDTDSPIVIISLAGTQNAWPRGKSIRYFSRNKVVVSVSETVFLPNPNIAARPNTYRLREAMTKQIIKAEEELKRISHKELK